VTLWLPRKIKELIHHCKRKGNNLAFSKREREASMMQNETLRKTKHSERRQPTKHNRDQTLRNGQREQHTKAHDIHMQW